MSLRVNFRLRINKSIQNSLKLDAIDPESPKYLDESYFNKYSWWMASWPRFATPTLLKKDYLAIFTNMNFLQANRQIITRPKTKPFVHNTILIITWQWSFLKIMIELRLNLLKTCTFVISDNQNDTTSFQFTSL
jgi:hypothetical protein